MFTSSTQIKPIIIETPVQQYLYQKSIIPITELFNGLLMSISTAFLFESLKFQGLNTSAIRPWTQN